MTQSSSAPSQLEFHLENIRLGAQRWGEGSTKKVLALHGWLDNSASFSRLAPSLVDCDVVALDLAGHGKSEWRASFGAYNIWQDLIEIQQVLEQLGWQSCSLLGHSRGAMIATLFAGAFPKQVLGLAMIDALAPMTSPASDLPKQLSTAVHDLLSMKERDLAYYKSFQACVNARMRGLYPLSESASRLFAERSVAQNEQGFYWAHDPLLKVASEVRLTEEQVLAFVDRFPVQAKVIIAEQGYMAKFQAHPLFHHEKVASEYFSGGHHLHLDAEPDKIQAVAASILAAFT